MLVVLVYAGAYRVLLQQPETGLRLLALLILAFISVQAGYIAHEAGHGAITRRVETISKHIVKIILYMKKHGHDMVKIERKQVRLKPRITPNYTMRELSILPAIYGTLEIPTIDNLLFFRFRESDYIFSGSGVAMPEKQYVAEHINDAR